MRVLLDTHALLWAVLDPNLLSTRARELLIRRDTEVSVSAASAWEIATKVRIGRLDDARPLVDTFGDQLDALDALPLAVTADHALLAGSLEWEHRDPFDRMIAAQALSEQLVLLTADRAFRGVPALATLW